VTDARFDTVAIVDWSATNGPSPAKPTADAIWIGTARVTGTEAQYVRTRAEAEAHLAALMEAETRAGRRLLIGFDFPMGYPAGFAARLTGQPDPRAVWRWLADHITDDGNRNNRFHVAAAINARLGGGPFWGRPSSLPLAHLPERKTVDYTALALPERRAVERTVPRAQPVWKLFTTGSVGSQALMGLPMIHRLSQHPGTAVWPFDPLIGAQAVLAEVYPSLLASLVLQQEGIKDRAQVLLLARALHTLSAQGRLGPLLTDIPDSAEEGWILGAGHEAALVSAAKG
jgi:molybdopterin-guanine dinucleotide biosynthesis adapter protein